MSLPSASYVFHSSHAMAFDVCTKRWSCWLAVRNEHLELSDVIQAYFLPVPPVAPLYGNRFVSPDTPCRRSGGTATSSPCSDIPSRECSSTPLFDLLGPTLALNGGGGNRNNRCSCCFTCRCEESFPAPSTIPWRLVYRHASGAWLLLRSILIQSSMCALLVKKLRPTVVFKCVPEGRLSRRIR